jgi:hypothetical protein
MKTHSPIIALACLFLLTLTGCASPESRYLEQRPHDYRSLEEGAQYFDRLAAAELLDKPTIRGGSSAPEAGPPTSAIEHRGGTKERRLCGLFGCSIDKWWRGMTTNQKISTGLAAAVLTWAIHAAIQHANDGDHDGGGMEPSSQCIPGYEWDVVQQRCLLNW